MNMKFFGTAFVLSAVVLLEGCSVSTSGNTPPTIFTGTILAGAPLAASSLTVTDSSTPARVFTASLLADSTYSVDTASGVAPFLFHVRGQAGSRPVEFFSASAASYGKVNISPLTSLVVASAAGQDCAVVACTPASFTAARLTNAATEVQTRMIPLLTQFGLAIADSLDSKQSNPAKTRKWVFFKHIAVGGFVFSRDGPLEFIKDAASGNWRMAGNQQVKIGAKAGKDGSIYTPPPGASNYGQWLPFSSDTSAYPDGATLIVVSSSGISPPVNLVYAENNSGAVRTTGASMVDAVTDVSFLPACPRHAGQPGSCIEVAQIASGGIYSAGINLSADRLASTYRQARSPSKQSIIIPKALVHEASMAEGRRAKHVHANTNL